LTFDFRPFHDKVDLCFIDGGHSEECVKSDTKNAFRMVKKGGVIIWHDFLNVSEYWAVTKIIYQ